MKKNKKKKQQQKNNNNNNNKKQKQKTTTKKQLPPPKKKKKKKTIIKKKKKTTRPAFAASTAGPCPTICQSSRTPRHWKLPSTIARPNHPLVTDEALLAETTFYDPSSFLWMFSLLLNGLIFIVLHVICIRR